MNTILRNERVASMFGVPGRFFNVIGEPGAAVLRNQKFITESRPCPSYGSHAVIRAEVCFDDECKNGHNSFAITASVRDTRYKDDRGDIAGGCCHDAIAKSFPELAPLVRWHLTSSDGPMHYISNTIYLAGIRDCWGKLAGEPRQFATVIQFGDNPLKHKLPAKFVAWLQSCVPLHGERAFDFEVLGIDHKDRATYGTYYTFGGYGASWHECPFHTEAEALDFLKALQTCNPKFISVATSFGEGKARDLAAARSTAVWPEATDAELCAEPAELRAALLARHPDRKRVV